MHRGTRLGAVIPVYASTSELVEDLSRTLAALANSARFADVTPLPILLCVNRLDDPAALDAAVARTMGALDAAVQPGRGSVAAAWNDGLQWAWRAGLTHLLVLNQDSVCYSDTVAGLMAFADTAADVACDLWTATNTRDHPDPPPPNTPPHPTPDFSCYMVLVEGFVARHGWFDENYFPAYFEDNDIHARVVLGGRCALRLPTVRYYHEGSTVIRNDPDRARAVSLHYGMNERYFIAKWGTRPINDAHQFWRAYFPRPFGKANLPLRYWPTPTPDARRAALRGHGLGDDEPMAVSDPIDPSATLAAAATTPEALKASGARASLEQRQWP
jgi:hypothetical protein